MPNSSNPMIPDLESYFDQWLPEQKTCLQQLETEARQADIPIVGPVVGQMLNILIRGCKAQQILELGTANGYSTLWMAEAAMATRGMITTIECNPRLVQTARSHFQDAGVADRVKILEGPAQTILSGLNEIFDFIFMDIDKIYYLEMLPLCTEHMKKGGMMVIDNTGFEDADAFNRAIAKDERWLTVNVLAHLPGHSPLKDGICLAVRI